MDSQRRQDHRMSYIIHRDQESLSPEIVDLYQIAKSQLSKAYAPYSQFHVGAAVRLIDGQIFKGANQENASYPLSMCGERVALYNVGANDPDTPIESLVIVVQNKNKPLPSPVSPCGACRQVISEFEKRQGKSIRIFLGTVDTSEIYEIESGADLLPLLFDDSFL